MVCTISPVVLGSLPKRRGNPVQDFLSRSNRGFAHPGWFVRCLRPPNKPARQLRLLDCRVVLGRGEGYPWQRFSRWKPDGNPSPCWSFPVRTQKGRPKSGWLRFKPFATWRGSSFGHGGTKMGPVLCEHQGRSSVLMAKARDR